MARRHLHDHGAGHSDAGGRDCLFGFFIGVVVDEKQRVSAELRKPCALPPPAKWPVRWLTS
jgi:hypothetical protein